MLCCELRNVGRDAGRFVYYQRVRQAYEVFAAASGIWLSSWQWRPTPVLRQRQSNASQLAVFARPLGVWCDGIARFTVGALESRSGALVVGVPRRPDTRFPYKTMAVDVPRQAGQAGAEAVDAAHGGDCELCATPDIRVTLGAAEELTWTMENGHEISAGPASLRLTLYWYGGPSKPESCRASENEWPTDQALAVAGVDDRCFVASAVPKGLS